MTKITILGSSSVFPFPRTQSNRFEDYLDIENYQNKFTLHDDPICNLAKKGDKNKRTRSCLVIEQNNKIILFDAGPDILYQLKRVNLKKPDVICITHAHPDANYGLRYFPGVLVKSEVSGTIMINQPFELFGLKIIPFRVQHAKNTPTVGFSIRLKNDMVIVYATDFSSLRGLKQYFQAASLIIVDGSILNRSFGGHCSIARQLAAYKRWHINQVLFTHIGHSTLPHEQLSEFVKDRFPNAGIAYDGMVIKI